MKREILNHKLRRTVNGSCPGHDDWPDETYRSRRSKRARSRDKQKEHQLARTFTKQDLTPEMYDAANLPAMGGFH